MPRCTTFVTLFLLAFSFTAAQADSPVLSSLSDPRAVAMGSAGVASFGGPLSADANPALLALATTAELQALGPVSKGFHEDSQLWQIGALWPADADHRFLPAVGVTYRDYELAGEFSVRTAFDPESDSVVLSTRTQLTSLALALPAWRSVALGGVLRYADTQGVTGWYGDAGVVVGGELHRDERFRVEGTLAVAARELGDDIQRVYEASTPSPNPPIFETVRVVTVPVTAHLAWGGSLVVARDALELTLALQIDDPLEAGTAGELYEHVGLELGYRDRIAVRAGVIDDAWFDTEFTYGAGVSLPVASRVKVGLDYAREPALPARALGFIDTHAPGASHFFALRVAYDLR